MGPQCDSGQKCLTTRVGCSLYSHSVLSLLLALHDQSLYCDTKAHCLTIPSTYLLLSLKADVSELIRNSFWVIQGNWNIPSLPLTALLKFWSKHCRTATFHPADLGWMHFCGFQPASTTSSLSKVHRLLPVLKPLKFIKIIIFDHLHLPWQ